MSSHRSSVFHSLPLSFHRLLALNAGRPHCVLLVFERVADAWCSYKNHTQAFVEDYEDQITGETKQRYVNRSRHVAYSIPVIAHSTEGIPMEPVKGLMDKLKKADQRILDKMKEVSVILGLYFVNVFDLLP